jgi:hypothetical protein
LNKINRLVNWKLVTTGYMKMDELINSLREKDTPDHLRELTGV